MKTVLAADFGGTKCRFALVAEDFAVHRVTRFATVRDRQQFLALVTDAVGQVRAALPQGLEEPAAIGIGTAGVILPGGRVISHAPNLPLAGFHLAEHLERECGLPVSLLNDGRASAWGEYLRGHARAADPLLCLFFGTGIGIGLMYGGRPYEGAGNAAGEIGHTVHVHGGRLCPCGGRGHFEAYCAGRPLTEQAAALGPPPAGAAWTVGALAALGRQGDARARAILAAAEVAAGAMVANACTLLNPRAVVLGGGVLEGWPELRGSIEAYVRSHCSAPVLDGLRFVESLGGSDAILWGASAATGALWRS
jgi:glucokinase